MKKKMVYLRKKLLKKDRDSRILNLNFLVKGYLDLENNKMDFVIGHDVELEIKIAFEKILNFNENSKSQISFFSDILIFNRYNCLDKKVY